MSIIKKFFIFYKEILLSVFKIYTNIIKHQCKESRNKLTYSMNMCEYYKKRQIFDSPETKQNKDFRKKIDN